LWDNEFLNGEKSDLHYQLEIANTRKTAIVTGGSQGIGAGLVKVLTLQPMGQISDVKDIVDAIFHLA